MGMVTSADTSIFHMKPEMDQWGDHHVSYNTYMVIAIDGISDVDGKRSSHGTGTG